MITPQEAATLVDWPNPSRHKEIHEFVLSASAREIQLFIHSLQMDMPTTASREWLNRAQIALDIKLAEDSEQTAQKLVAGTESLIIETKTLVKLTHRLYVLTIVLIALGAFDFLKFLFGLFCHKID